MCQKKIDSFLHIVLTLELRVDRKDACSHQCFKLFFHQFPCVAAFDRGVLKLHSLSRICSILQRQNAMPSVT